ncbi:Dabb family protein [Candidatus Pacearchaeota archaeon]|nr:Dabb family protein [Candidatus Pacearchaeota archaeon]
MVTENVDLEKILGNGFSHIVLYQTNPNNPQAVQQIIDNANRYLAQIPGVRDFLVAPRYDSGRAVQVYRFDVGMNITFDSEDEMLAYMRHPDHMRFVEFVLNGWRLEDTDKKTVKERKLEFMNNVLNATPKNKRKWAVDTEVPDSERVWADEQVYDFYKSD